MLSWFWRWWYRDDKIDEVLAANKATPIQGYGQVDRDRLNKIGQARSEEVIAGQEKCRQREGKRGALQVVPKRRRQA